MFPMSSKGYMPYLQGQNGEITHKRPTGVRYTAKHGKREHKKLKAGKTYQVTLRDKAGRTYTYIMKTDGSKSIPSLCDSVVNGLKSTDSLQTIGLNTSPKRSLNSSMNLPLDSQEDGKKGIFRTILKFLKEKTGGKSKRKPKTEQPMRKRRRTVSAMSNLDPIQEYPEEEEYEDDDNESYSHFSSCSSSDTDSLEYSTSITSLSPSEVESRTTQSDSNQTEP